MATIVSCRSLQPWRILVTVDSGTPSTSPGNYTITRADGLVTDLAVSLAWNPGANTAELALTGPLQDGVDYVVALSGAGSAAVAYRAPEAAPEVQAANSEITQQRLGLDLAWCSSGALDARRQVPRRVGQECLKHDLAAVALTAPTEIFHRPQAGANLASFTNANSEEQARATAAVRSAWTRDPRVATGSCSVTPTMDQGTGELSMSGQVDVLATGERLDVSTSDIGG